MKKLCSCGSPGIVPVEMLLEHCKGKTKLLEGLSEESFLCEDHCCEIMLDSQWDTGWKNRAEFLFGEISENYNDPVPGRGWKALQKAALIVYNAGISALQEMCPICSDINTDSEHGDMESLPEPLKILNQKYFDLYLPLSMRTEYGNVICPKCAKNKLAGKRKKK